MLIDINPEMEPKEYKVVLCKLNKEPLTELENIHNRVLTVNFANINEFTFSVPSIAMGTEDEPNPIFDMVEGDHILEINEEEYFLIDSVVEKSDSSGETYKEVHSFSLEYELKDKNLVGYEFTNRVLYSPTNAQDEGDGEGNHKVSIGILNQLEKETTWTVGSYTNEALTKQRELKFASSNWLQVLLELQKIYKCIFQFDTKLQKINIYHADQLGHNNGLYISDENFIKDISRTTNSSNIKTRLTIKGAGDTSIRHLTPNGMPYIENYNFYKTTKYMTQSLIDGLNGYEEEMKRLSGDFGILLERIESEQVKKGDAKDKFVELDTALKVIQSELDDLLAVLLGFSRNPNRKPTATDIKEEADNKEAIRLKKVDEADQIKLVEAKNAEIVILEAKIKAIEVEMELVNEKLKIENFLSVSEIMEFGRFIKEDVYLDSAYPEEYIKELLEDGKKVLAKISQPAVTFDLSVDNFLNLIECQHIWKNFNIGDEVNLSHSKLGADWVVKMIKYVHSIDDNSLDLTFSNRDNIEDANAYIEELLDNASATSTNVDFSKFQWDKAKDAESTISKYVSNNLDLANQAIAKAHDQRPIIDERGIWITKENSNGSMDQEQMRIIHNTLAITRDNWDTLEVAIDAKNGINANEISGKMGNFAQINSSQIEIGNFDGPGADNNLTKHLEDEQGRLDGILGEMYIVIDSAFSDGEISSAEAHSIESVRINLVKLANSVQVVANGMSLDKAKTNEKTEFANAKTATDAAINALNNILSPYLNKDNYPIAVTNKQAVKTTFQNLEKAIARLNIAINMIRETFLIKDGSTYNSVKISAAAGLEALRGDGKVKTTLNASDGIFIEKINGHNKERIFYIDANDGSLKMKGSLELTHGGIKLGYTNKVNDSSGFNFTVDNDGKVVGKNLQILGGRIELGKKADAYSFIVENDGKVIAKGIDVENGSIVGGNIKIGPTIGGTGHNFEVDRLGKIIAKNIDVQDGVIRGGRINIKDNFTVSSEGIVTAKDIIITGGKANIGQNFAVNRSGDLTVKGNVNISGNIVMGGDITWGAGNTPVQAKYSETKYGEYHSDFREGDIFTKYSYNGGKNWTDPVKTQGKDGIIGKDGEQGPQGPRGLKGDQANLPEFIVTTEIGPDYMQSPEIYGAYIEGARIISKGTENYFQLQNRDGREVGIIKYDESGSSYNGGSAKRMFIQSSSGYVMKIESGGNMSINATGRNATGENNKVYIGDCHFSGTTTGVTARFA